MALSESQRVLDEFLQLFTFSACKNPTTDFYNLGQTCKHVFCPACVTKYKVSAYNLCPTCFFPLATKATKCFLASNLYEYLMNVKEAMIKVAQFSSGTSPSTRSAIESLKALFGDTAPRRTFEEFAATQRVNDFEGEKSVFGSPQLKHDLMEDGDAGELDLNDSQSTLPIDEVPSQSRFLKRIGPLKKPVKIFASQIPDVNPAELPGTQSPSLKPTPNLFASQMPDLDVDELPQTPPSPQFKIPSTRRVSSKKKSTNWKMELLPNFDSPGDANAEKENVNLKNKRRFSSAGANELNKEKELLLCQSQNGSETTIDAGKEIKSEMSPMGGLSAFRHKSLFEQRLGLVKPMERRSAPLPNKIMNTPTRATSSKARLSLADNFLQNSSRPMVTHSSHDALQTSPQPGPSSLAEDLLIPDAPTSSGHNLRKRARIAVDKFSPPPKPPKQAARKTPTSNYSKQNASNSISSFSSSEEFVLDNFLSTTPINRELISLTPKPSKKGRPRSSGPKKTSLRAPVRPGELNVINAVLTRDVGRVQALIKASVNLNERDSRDGSTPLFLAVTIGHVEICQMLLNAGAIPNAHCTKGCETALHIAVTKNFVEIARLLVSKGANKAAANLKKQTPLDCLNSLPAEDVEEMKQVLEHTHGRRSSKEITYYQRHICIPSGQGIDPSLIMEIKLAQLFQSVTDVIDDQTTHLVVGGVMPNGTVEYSLLIVEAMARGIMIVSTKYLEESIKHRSIPHNEGTFEIRRILRDDVPIVGSEGSCREMRLRELLMKPRIFVGANFFFASQQYACFERVWLRQIILCGGGQVVNRERELMPVSGTPSAFYDDANRAPYFVLLCPGDLNNPFNKTSAVKNHLTVISPTWIIDCILCATFRSDAY